MFRATGRLGPPAGLCRAPPSRCPACPRGGGSLGGPCLLNRGPVRPSSPPAPVTRPPHPGVLGAWQAEHGTRFPSESRSALRLAHQRLPVSTSQVCAVPPAPLCRPPLRGRPTPPSPLPTGQPPSARADRCPGGTRHMLRLARERNPCSLAPAPRLRPPGGRAPRLHLRGPPRGTVPPAHACPPCPPPAPALVRTSVRLRTRSPSRAASPGPALLSHQLTVSLSSFCRPSFRARPSPVAPPSRAIPPPPRGPLSVSSQR